MYSILLDLHSLLRYVALLLLIITVIKAFSGWLEKKQYTSLDNKLSLFTLIAMHLQLVIGLLLYFISPIVQAGISDMVVAMKNPELRFWTVEHISLMIVAIALITVGRIVSKKTTDSVIKHKKTAIFFLLGLLLILVSIPWPFTKIARAWF